MQFPWNKYWFWLGLQSAGKFNLKLHIDAGDFSFLNKKFNLFSNLKTQTDFKNVQIRVGANYWGTSCESNTRLDINSCCGDKGHSLTQRTLVKRDNLFYGFVGTIGFQGWCFARYDAILGYENANVNFYLQHKSGQVSCNSETKDCHGLKLGSILATAVFKRDKNTFGVEACHCHKGTCVSVAAQSQINDSTTLKAKINKNFDLAFAYKKRFSDLLTFTTSALLQLKETDKILHHKGLLPVPLGFQFELNI